MRDEFIKVLMEKAAEDKNLMLLTGDLGFGVLSKFAEKYPNQFLNVGIAEQNMAGVAAGLAMEGKIVFTYSIANFNTLRCLEQIRNDICYHNANVKIVSVGGGFCYGALGISHHATEDLSIMGSIPNIRVVAPGDKMETSLATSAIYNTQGPFYMRLGRGGEPLLYDYEPSFKIGKAIPIFNQGEVALLSIGGILENVLEARKLISAQGITSSVYSFPTLRPFDADLIMEIAREVRLIVTIEEHIIHGGLGSRVACILSEISFNKPLLVRIGIGENFICEVGDQNYLRQLCGLAPKQIVQRVISTIKNLK
ncbi:MAG: transketolase [Desulfobacterales bacterium]|nr:transketolase [Desulfobacterales bacterium]